MGGGHHGPSAMPTYNQDHKAMEKASVPLSHRDTCAHLLIPLNKCRRMTYFMPFSCGDERHVYEECEYNAYLQRVEMKKQMSK